MKRRMKMSRRGSKKLFRRTAKNVHPKNVRRPIMRGGIRL